MHLSYNRLNTLYDVTIINGFLTTIKDEVYKFSGFRLILEYLRDNHSD